MALGWIENEVCFIRNATTGIRQFLTFLWIVLDIDIYRYEYDEPPNEL
jgi:hypothetical protein